MKMMSTPHLLKNLKTALILELKIKRTNLIAENLWEEETQHLILPLKNKCMEHRYII